MQHRAIRRVSVTPTGGFLPRYSRYYSLQNLAAPADGRFIAFVCSFPDLDSPAPGDPNGDPYHPYLSHLLYTTSRVGPLS